MVGTAVARRASRSAADAATTPAMILFAPSARNASAPRLSVAPVVTTSSMTTMLSGTRRPAWRTGPSRRDIRSRPFRLDPARRRSVRRHGRPNRRATARARISPWSNPRARRWAGWAGTHVTRSTAVRSHRRERSAASSAADHRSRSRRPPFFPARINRELRSS